MQTKENDFKGLLRFQICGDGMDKSLMAQSAGLEPATL